MTDGVSGPLTAKEIVENVHSKSNAKKGMDFKLAKVGCVFLVAIWPEFRLGQQVPPTFMTRLGLVLKSYKVRDIWWILHCWVDLKTIALLS